MPIDRDRFKQDPRTPQQLANAILDHEVTPRAGKGYGMTFREQLWADYDTLHQMDHPVLRKWGSGLLLTLKRLEEGVTNSTDRENRRQLSHALDVIQVYRREQAEWRDAARGDTNLVETVQPHENWSGLPRDWYQREAADDVETHMVAISNLSSVEKLMRILADKLGISLREPGRKK
jgi:hypothetical protein